VTGPPSRTMADAGLQGVIVILTERCNSRCVMCDYWRIEQPRVLARCDLVDFWNRRMGMRPHFVSLSGGEPLLYPDLFAVAHHLSARTDCLVLSTNGLLLDSACREVATHFHKVIVSIDGATADTVRKIRGVDQLERALHGVTAVLRHGHGIRLVLKMTLQKANFRELPAFVDMARALGVSGIALTVPELASRAFLREAGTRASAQRDLLLSAADAAEFADIAGQVASKVAADPGTASSFLVEGDLTRFVEFFDYHSGRAHALSPRQACSVAGTRLVVYADGQLRPCFFLPPIGHIQDPVEGNLAQTEAGSGQRTGFDVAASGTCRSCCQFLQWRF
jgi:MoaA/NifB/PqqE/SkfB family radical SAM enzyme